jgi:ligand-binding SRPBCC domain-containing protein
MRTYQLERTQVVPRPLEESFSFFADAANLEAITPPWLRFRIVSPPTRMRQGSLIEYRLRWRGIPLYWLTRIEEWRENWYCVDQQIRWPARGPRELSPPAALRGAGGATGNRCRDRTGRSGRS